MNLQSLFTSSATLLSGAFLLDFLIGDPRWLPHPVVLMGRVISTGERLLLRGNPHADFFAGMALSLSLVVLSTGSAALLVSFFHRLPFGFALLASTAFASTTLATRGLLDAVKSIEAPLREGNLARAREALGHIVGRETADLDGDKVVRAALESLAESTCDGIIAPLFYLFLGGIPLAVAFKAASTLDSMIGYRTERYFYFGKFAARLDDMLNFLPARMTACVIVLATLVLRLNPARAFRIAWRDGAIHLSLNAGYPEAALAGALGVRLGGPSVYFGKKINKPFLGEDWTSVNIDMLKKGRALCLLAAILSLAIFLVMSIARR